MGGGTKANSFGGGEQEWMGGWGLYCRRFCFERGRRRQQQQQWRESAQCVFVSVDGGRQQRGGGVRGPGPPGVVFFFPPTPFVLMYSRSGGGGGGGAQFSRHNASQENGREKERATQAKRASKQTNAREKETRKGEKRKKRTQQLDLSVSFLLLVASFRRFFIFVISVRLLLKGKKWAFVFISPSG